MSGVPVPTSDCTRPCSRRTAEEGPRRDAAFRLGCVRLTLRRSECRDDVSRDRCAGADRSLALGLLTIVGVRACALNHLDLWQRRGIERVRIPLPHISGSDVAGEVVEPGRSGLAAGTRVMIHPGVGCGRCRACASGRDNECPSYGVLGYQTDGGYAQLVAVPPESLVPLPAGTGFVEAAAFPLTFLTAWHMLVGRAGVSHVASAGSSPSR